MAESPVIYDYNSSYKTMQALIHEKFKYGLYTAQMQTPQRHYQVQERHKECLYMVTITTEGAHNGAARVALVWRCYVTILSLHCHYYVPLVTLCCL